MKIGQSYTYDPVLGYVPSIPLPFFGTTKWWKFWIHYVCQCGQGFSRQKDYEIHYALTHIPPI